MTWVKNGQWQRCGKPVEGPKGARHEQCPICRRGCHPAARCPYVAGPFKNKFENGETLFEWPPGKPCPKCSEKHAPETCPKGSVAAPYVKIMPRNEMPRAARGGGKGSRGGARGGNQQRSQTDDAVEQARKAIASAMHASAMGGAGDGRWARHEDAFARSRACRPVLFS